MTNEKTTRRALITSILALLFCFVMLVGTTFAWFTDSAIVYGNKIESGTLDIVLEMYDETTGTWVDAQAKTLNFKDANGAAVTYWEPGASYVLPELRVTNKGNLAAKFKVQVTGINGDAELNEIITWTAAPVENGVVGSFSDLTAFCNNEYSILPQSGSDTYTFQIKGTMGNDAGNEYQNLAIDNISVAVLATQLSGVEEDSAGNTYDENAEYPVVSYVNTAEELHTALTNIADGATIYMNAGTYTTNRPFQIYGKSVNIIGIDNVEVCVTTADTKAFYITSGVGANQDLNVRLANITVTTQYSSDPAENSKARGSIWLRSDSESPDPIMYQGNINLTLDNVIAPSMQTDNNYDEGCIFNVKLKNSTITHWVNLEARHNSEPNYKGNAIDTYTNFTYDENSTVKGLKVQASVADAAVEHITVNGVVPAEKGVVLN